MRIAMLFWEFFARFPWRSCRPCHRLAAALERKGNEVHVFTRMGPGQSHYQLIHGVHYHRCPFQLHSDFVEEVNNMCRSFVHHVLATEDFLGPFDIVHAHDWLAANAMIWIKQGRSRKTILTVHLPSTGAAATASMRAAGAHSTSGARCNLLGGSGDCRLPIPKMKSCGCTKSLSGKSHRKITVLNLRHFEGWLDPAFLQCRNVRWTRWSCL